MEEAKVGDDEGSDQSCARTDFSFSRYNSSSSIPNPLKRLHQFPRPPAILKDEKPSPARKRRKPAKTRKRVVKKRKTPAHAELATTVNEGDAELKMEETQQQEQSQSHPLQVIALEHAHQSTPDVVNSAVLSDVQEGYTQSMLVDNTSDETQVNNTQINTQSSYSQVNTQIIYTQDNPEANINTQDNPEANINTQDNPEANINTQSSSEVNTQIIYTQEANINTQDNPEANIDALDNHEANINTQDNPEANINKSQDNPEQNINSQDNHEANIDTQDNHEANINTQCNTELEYNTQAMLSISESQMEAIVNATDYPKTHKNWIVRELPKPSAEEEHQSWHIPGFAKNFYSGAKKNRSGLLFVRIFRSNMYIDHHATSSPAADVSNCPVPTFNCYELIIDKSKNTKSFQYQSVRRKQPLSQSVPEPLPISSIPEPLPISFLPEPLPEPFPISPVLRPLSTPSVSGPSLGPSASLPFLSKTSLTGFMHYVTDAMNDELCNDNDDNICSSPVTSPVTLTPFDTGLDQPTWKNNSGTY